MRASSVRITVRSRTWKRARDHVVSTNIQQWKNQQDSRITKKTQADSLITVKNEQYSEACDEKIEWLTNLNLFQKREWPHEK